MIHLIKRSSLSTKNKWLTAFRSVRKGLDKAPSNYVPNVGFAGISSSASDTLPRVARQVNGNSTLLRDQLAKRSQGGIPLTKYPPFQLATSSGENLRNSYSVRCFASKTTESSRQNQSETRKEISRAEDPFDDITYNIPQKPVTFTEGASYSVIILAGLAVAGVAAYGVFKELIFEPKEYRVFNKSLKRIQDDSQVRVRIGSPITGYGSESRNRAARQRIPHQVWTDDDGVEHVKISFHIRGSHGAAVVFSEMFKDKEDKQWKFMYLIVEVNSPSPSQLILESYVPA